MQLLPTSAIDAQELSYASRATPDDFGRQRDCHFMGAYSPLFEWQTDVHHQFDVGFTLF
ncbi:hypothetical protein PGS49_22310 [Yersinia intermedia]|uniref:hypothetical protein n=1 Tax=Yersinia intermedia TaxID=631 RepID=UPI0022FF37E9|nr:hypothetical protein [Yersinia intermedia]MDA5483339.1 hypothetical protein [Yersinia intermedia]